MHYDEQETEGKDLIPLQPYGASSTTTLDLRPTTSTPNLFQSESDLKTQNAVNLI